MIIYDILFILQFQVSTTAMDLIAVFALFVFMLALPCFRVLPFFSMNKDLYNNLFWPATARCHDNLMVDARLH